MSPQPEDPRQFLKAQHNYCQPKAPEMPMSNLGFEWNAVGGRQPNIDGPVHGNGIKCSNNIRHNPKATTYQDIGTYNASNNVLKSEERRQMKQNHMRTMQQW